MSDRACAEGCQFSLNRVERFPDSQRMVPLSSGVSEKSCMAQTFSPQNLRGWVDRTHGSGQLWSGKWIWEIKPKSLADEGKELNSGLLCWLHEDRNAHIKPSGPYLWAEVSTSDPFLFSPLKREKEVLIYKTSEYILRISFHLFTHISKRVDLGLFHFVFFFFFSVLQGSLISVQDSVKD